jgi:hypothetical protein
MRDVDDFHLIDQGRLRFGDRLRFLFFGWAYKRRFTARAARCGIVFSARQPAYGLLAAAAGVAIFCVTSWLGEQLHEARMLNQAMAADLHNLRASHAALPQPGTPATPQRTPEVRIVRENPDKTAQRGQAELERAWADARDLGEQVKEAREQVASLRSEIAASRSAEARWSDQVHDSELRVTGMTAELARLQAGRAEDTEIIAAQRLRLREITDRLNASTDTIERERKLLVADLDIRELMGARSLHIVDVFDVDGKGKTQRPFGRIFYTQGKSLLFYAFDLKSGGTFQAWGQRETRDESAQSLGMFYVDDQKQNRWVLKFEDPKVLAEINAVFVTVEPPGGSIKPNRQKMLYAYLNATPNHP